MKHRCFTIVFAKFPLNANLCGKVNASKQLSSKQRTKERRKEGNNIIFVNYVNKESLSRVLSTYQIDHWPVRASEAEICQDFTWDGWFYVRVLQV